jgi:hypothetical protein
MKTQQTYVTAMFHFLHQGHSSLPKHRHQTSRNSHPQNSLIIEPALYVVGKHYFTDDVIWTFAECSSTERCLDILRGVSKTFGEWHQNTNKTEHTNKLTLLAFKIIAILHSTQLATFIKLLETVSKGIFRNRSQNRCHTIQERFLKTPLLTVSRSFMNVTNSVVKDGDYFEGQ